MGKAVFSGTTESFSSDMALQNGRDPRTGPHRMQPRGRVKWKSLRSLRESNTFGRENTAKSTGCRQLTTYFISSRSLGNRVEVYQMRFLISKVFGIPL